MSINGAPVIQRAVGYEYELDGAVSARQENSFSPFSQPKMTGLKKGEVIVEKSGFSVTADEIPLNQGGGSDIEIIIKEIDDRDRRGKEKLIKTVQDLVQFLTALQRTVRSEPISASTFGGAANVYVAGAMDNGTLQASVGMTLAALAKFRSGEMGQYHDQQLTTMGDYPDPLRSSAKDSQAAKAYYLRAYGADQLAYTGALNVVKAQLPKLAPWYQSEIAGVMSVIVIRLGILLLLCKTHVLELASPEVS